MADVVLLNPDMREWEMKWDTFLASHQHLIYHTPQFYRFIERTFKQKMFYLGALEQGKLALMLPCVALSHPLFGKKILSMGYVEYGGFAGKKEHIPFILNYLGKQDAAYVEIRQGLEEFDAALPKQLQVVSEYKRFLLPLGKEKDIWDRMQKHKRKAIK